MLTPGPRAAYKPTVCRWPTLLPECLDPTPIPSWSSQRTHFSPSPVAAGERGRTREHRSGAQCMKIGVNTWVWSAPLTTDEFARLAAHVAGMGFDLIEVPIETPGDFA